MYREQIQWAESLRPGLHDFIQSLRDPAQPGRFRPSSRDLTPQGERIALGFSCFALKVYYTLGWWDTLDVSVKNGWVDFIRTFQTGDDGAFVDPEVESDLRRSRTWRVRLIGMLTKTPDHLMRTRIAETKQAVATLAQVGKNADIAVRGYASTPDAVDKFLRRFDWTQPWSSGAQFANQAVLMVTQSSRYSDSYALKPNVEAYGSFIQTLADSESGGYFLGNRPEHGQLINGAMKVLSGLDWLEIPIHYPERLIDTCLSAVPRSEGCHLVDAVYVLYRCSRQVEYRIDDIRRYIINVLNMLRKHHNTDGGFSFHAGRRQEYYYGVPVCTNVPCSDLHGTSLLVWAVAMALDLLGDDSGAWRVIQP